MLLTIKGNIGLNDKRALSCIQGKQMKQPHSDNKTPLVQEQPVTSLHFVFFSYELNKQDIIC